MAFQENGDSSEPQSRARTPSPERQSRPTKRRKVRHKVRGGVYQDGKSLSRAGVRLSLTRYCSCYERNRLGEGSTRALSNVCKFSGHLCSLVDRINSFFHGCSTFLPVFDANTDTYEALHDRSPFAVNCICMVAARVRDGGGDNLSYRLFGLIIDEPSCQGKLARHTRRCLRRYMRSLVHLYSHPSLATKRSKQ
jgi:hypothetical protein